MERRIEVFFYGLFMDEAALRDQGFRPADARQARVDGFALRLGARATLVPDGDRSVHVDREIIQRPSPAALNRGASSFSS